MTQQPPTPPMGERRRRREAERKAAQATGELELNEPMTRRERRALEEALASGALELTPDGQYAPTGEVPVTTTGQHVLSGLESAESAASAEGTGDGDAAAEPAKPSSPAEAPERHSWRETAQEVDAVRPPPTMDKAPDGAAPGDQSPSPGSGAAGTATSADGPGDTGAGQLSRRSLRERQAAANAGAPEEPSERTATGRRPVIRPPASARGTRTVDATGELTSIQRAIRDIKAAPAGAPEPGAAPGELEAAPEAAGPNQPVLAAAEAEASVASASSAASATSTSSASSAEDDEDEEQADDSFDMSPRWPSVSATATQPGGVPALGETEADQATGAAPSATEEDTRGSAASPRGTASPARADSDDAEATDSRDGSGEDADDDGEDDEDERHTPRVLQVLYWLVLVLAGLVLGLLVWRMATGDLFGGEDALALAGPLLPLRQ